MRYPTSKSFWQFLTVSKAGSDVSSGISQPMLGGRITTFFPIGLLFSIAIGVGLRLLWLGKREFWYDEVLSVLLSTGQKRAYRHPTDVPFSLSDLAPVLRLPSESGLGESLGTVEALLRGNLSEPHPPLLYLITHGWMRLFGNSELATRTPVMLMSLVALVTAFLLGRRILGQRGGLIFTALLALNPFFLSHSLNLRMYSPLVLWACLSALCLFVLMGVDRSDSVLDTSLNAPGLTNVLSDRVAQDAAQDIVRHQSQADSGWRCGWRAWLLRGIVAASLTAGLMTQYLFGYWFFALAATVLFLDRKHWFAHGSTLAGGALLFLPWGLWGTLRQVSNRADVLERISANGGFVTIMLQHGKDLTQTVADYLLLGHLTTSMLPMAEPIKPTAVAIGCGVVGFVVLCVVDLYRKRQYWVLTTCFLLGVFPLLLALGVDVVGNKNTLGFGWGRATIVVLPGCVLLVAAWLEKATGRWREILTAGLLLVYLAVNVGDFVGRDRQMFHQVNATLLDSDQSTLVVMNSRAWGHVNRLVYYLDEVANPDLLTAKPAEVTTVLSTALENKNYDRVLWLSANYPLWDAPEDEDELAQLVSETNQLLQSQYSLMSEQSLRGTMNLDSFELQVYQRPASS